MMDSMVGALRSLSGLSDFGYLGLIRWKLVMHAFIDGHSRYVTGFRVSDNNRASTVFDVFHEAIAEHGVPSRVRGDHGGENVQVAEFMEAYRGPGRGSYIWGRYIISSLLFSCPSFYANSLHYGRSVHNTRIERLWYDVTNGFGQKWKNFFIELETHCHLNAHNPGHIWLLHYLFKDAINEDATGWVRAWNRHVMQLKGELH